jgi:Glyoxalase/Bleomycin resistance protein/Dioxygenase superfamily
MKPCTTALIPLAQVQDVQWSADFYRLLGMEVRGSLRNSSGVLQWIDLFCEQAQLMLTRSAAPVVASQQAVLFYLYSPDVAALREHLLANGVNVSSITYLEYMPKGEVRVEDPDGYVLLIGQTG